MARSYAELSVGNSVGAWVNDRVIPGLSIKGYPLARVMRVLYRAGTYGVSDADYQETFAGLVPLTRAYAAEEQGASIVTPRRGEPRQLGLLMHSEGNELPLAIREELTRVPFTIKRSDGDGVYVAPANRLNSLVDQLTSTIDVQAARAENIAEMIPLLSEFILLFDALHPYLDGTGRTTRGVVNYLLYPLGYRAEFPLKDGHADSLSEMVAIMTDFRDAVQREEGYPVFTSSVLQTRVQIDYAQMSEKFSQIIAAGRSNDRLRLLYEKMDEVVVSMLRKNSPME